MVAKAASTASNRGSWHRGWTSPGGTERFCASGLFRGVEGAPKALKPISSCGRFRGNLKVPKSLTLKTLNPLSSASPCRLSRGLESFWVPKDGGV